MIYITIMQDKLVQIVNKKQAGLCFLPMLSPVGIPDPDTGTASNY